MIKERLLQEQELNLEKVVQITKNILTTQLQAQQLNKNPDAVVYKIDNQSDSQRSRYKKENFNRHS